MIQIRTPGRSLQVSSVGLGCMDFSYAYGAPTDAQDAVTLLRQAYDLGYTFFDTAEVYGTPADPHSSERLAGETLTPERHGDVGGVRWDETDRTMNN